MGFLCIICHESITSASSCVTTKCGHVFHNKCMTVWNERSKTCPACRAAVRTKADLIRIEFAPGDMKNELQFYQKKIIDKSAQINKFKAEIATLELDEKIFEITKSQKMKSLEQKLDEVNKKISDFQTGKIEPRPKVDHKANLESLQKEANKTLAEVHRMGNQMLKLTIQSKDPIKTTTGIKNKNNQNN